MVDKGKVLRNVYKKKLAEYVQAKEQKGQQDVTSETVPTTKDPIEKVVQRTPYKINLEIEGKKGKYPFVVNANLSVVERKKLLRVATAISNALKLNTASALAVRFENLLKKITNEADNYGIDYVEALRQVIQNFSGKVRDLVRSNQNVNQAKNNLNQIMEILDEKKEEKMPEEEGTPAVTEGVKELKLKLSTKQEEEEEEEEAPSAPAATAAAEESSEEEEEEGEPSAPAAASQAPTIQLPQEGVKNDPKTKVGKERMEAIRDITEVYQELYSILKSPSRKLRLRNLVNNFTKNINTFRTDKIVKAKFVEVSNAMKDIAREERESKKSGKGMSKGCGMRKGRYGTYRGVIGYGHTPQHIAAANKGFATAPMNANSPFGQKAFRAPQSNAIPKYLNFAQVLPNKSGNFAVLE
jgi:hypothetical protein